MWRGDRVRFISITMLLILSVLSWWTADSTEVDFWRPYTEADAGTYLLLSLDGTTEARGEAAPDVVRLIGPARYVRGRFGRALRLDGRGGLHVTPTELFPGGDLAVDAWVRLDALPSDRAYVLERPPIWNDVSGSPDALPCRSKGFAVWIDRDGRLGLETVNCRHGKPIVTQSPPGSVPVGRWVHLAAVCNGYPINFRRLYVDGDEVSTDEITWGRGIQVQGEEEVEAGPIVIGNDTRGTAGLRGAIHQARIHRNISRFWPPDDDHGAFTTSAPDLEIEPPYLLPRNASAIRFSFDDGLEPTGDPPPGVNVLADGAFVPGVRGRALAGTLTLEGPQVLDLERGSLEFWIQPVGFNSHSDRGVRLVTGPFTLFTDSVDGLRNKPLVLYFWKNDAEQHFVQAGDDETRPGRWKHVVITWRHDELAIYLDGRLVGQSRGEPIATSVNQGKCNRLAIGTGRSLLDEVTLYPHALGPEEAANAYFRYRDRSKLVPAVERTAHIRAHFLPSENRLHYQLASTGDAAVAEARLTLRDARRHVVGEWTVPFSTEERILELPELADGLYELSTRAKRADGHIGVGESFHFRRKHFVWEKNTLGMTDIVYPPFTPIGVEGDTLTVVGRSYRFGPLGLPAQVTAAGQELLAAPIRLRYETAEGEGAWNEPSGRFARTQPHVAVYEGEVTAPPVRVRLRSTTEIDGCIQVEMTLEPGPRAGEIRRLWLEIPLRDEIAPLMHAVTAGLRHNASGHVPPGQGIVWDATRAHQYQTWLNAFVPYIWVGSVHRGLAWFAENDRGWITRKTRDAALQELVREGDRLVLRVYLIDHPTTIRARHCLVFGLQASPTKPLPEDWRRRMADAPRGVACVPFGGLTYYSVTPLRDDWRIVDRILDVRYGNPRHEQWFDQYVASFRPPNVHGYWPWREAIRHFENRCIEHGPHRPLVVYHEGMRGCDSRPEWGVFQDEWTADGRRAPRAELPDHVYDRGYETMGTPQFITFHPSYQDFGCWSANEWLRRGLSLYWDNTYPIASTNVRTTAAYRADDGRIQPAMIIWNQREYTKRTWNLLQYWRRRRPEPLDFTLHMTNTLLLPVHTWSTALLNHELDHARPLPPDWLQAESTGRQAGGLPLVVFDILGTDNEMAAARPAAERERMEWGLRCVHEMEREGGLERLLSGFGYGRPHVAVRNYWDESPAVAVEPTDVKWLLLKDDSSGDCMLVLASWNEEPVRARVRIDRRQLGLTRPLAWFDAETGRSLPVTPARRGGSGATVESLESNEDLIELTIAGPWGNRVLRAIPH